ncbi:MAG: hypothetical protein JNM18_03750 [Planctomycetaceae bacterium]|nr:hypothetical protein [Planctomycetaceae bacterium]
MSTPIVNIADQERADIEAVMDAVLHHRKVDPEVRKRIDERANLIRAEIARKGVTNIAVELIRELRDE